MELAPETWVVIADGEKYLQAKNEGDKEHLDLRVMRQKEQDNPPTHQQGTDKPGRKDDAGIGSSAVEQTDWHQLEKERFTKDLAERLRKWALDDAYRHLLVIADPSTLGALRQEYHQEVKDRLVGEIDKDLTNHPLEDIEKIIRAA